MKGDTLKIKQFLQCSAGWIDEAHFLRLMYSIGTTLAHNDVLRIRGHNLRIRCSLFRTWIGNHPEGENSMKFSIVEVYEESAVEFIRNTKFTIVNEINGYGIARENDIEIEGQP